MWAAACITSAALAACAAPQVRAPDIAVSVIADSQRRDLEIAPGTTVANVLAQAGIELGPLDRVTPPLYSLIADGATVRVIRVRESFEIEQVAIPFQRRIVRNEALPPGETRLVQAGREGLQEITYRILTEDGVETSRTPLRTTLLAEPVPEILMIGASSSFETVPLKGALVYIDGGNAWILTQDSSNRFPLVASADLDSRIFALSPDGQWLLFSREDETRLNALFVVATFGGEQPFPLSIFNVIHFADWSPAAKRTIAYSTVEPVSSSPGWQARNDLRVISFDEKRNPAEEKILVAPNAEGIYSWWGTKFAWSPDGTRLAYSRPDEVGWIAGAGGARHPLLTFPPYRTQADWVWLPAIRWSPDGAFLITIRHGDPAAQESPEESTVFDLVALPSGGGTPITLFERAGMFAYPAPGPLIDRTYEQGYNVAFLEAARPLESDRSKYHLVISDRDGSNARPVFPPEGEPGLTPGEAGEAEWSPDGKQIALIYEGNLWIIDLATGESRQLTGDGQVTMIDWR
ncbi:MAG: G5 domain-containing protein [Anaerolineales bacterium]|nr:G5 domain-containing protein [Anaerolineales bacterium]